MNTLRVVFLGLVLTLVGTACGGVSGGPSWPPASVSTSSPGDLSPTTAQPNEPDLDGRVVAWCAAQTVDFCHWGLGMVGFERTPERIECLVAASSINEFIGSDCNREPEPPPTTIPQPTVTSPQTDTAELVAVEEWMRRVLVEAHPDDPVEAGVVLVEPASVDDAVRLVTTLGAEPFAVWRPDWICFDPYAENGLTGWPKQATRFAFLDGAAEAARRRAAAEASGEPIVGRDLYEAELTLLVLASEAVHEPGVRVEVVVAGVRPRDLDELENAPEVVAVRVLHAANRGIWSEDLTPGVPPDCD